MLLPEGLKLGGPNDACKVYLANRRTSHRHSTFGFLTSGCAGKTICGVCSSSAPFSSSHVP